MRDISSSGNVEVDVLLAAIKIASKSLQHPPRRAAVAAVAYSSLSMHFRARDPDDQVGCSFSQGVEEGVYLNLTA